MIVTLFREPREQARAIGAFSFAAAAGGSIGNIAGGVLTQALSWHWVFVVNVPVGLAVGLAAVRLLPADRGLGLRSGADVAGAVLVTAGLMAGVYAIVGAADHGWVSRQTLGVGGGALALLGAFVARQATATSPLLPLRVLRSRNLAGANLVQVFLVAGMFGFLFLSALYMQQVLDYDASQVGLAILPAALIIGAVSLGLSARLIARFGARTVLLPGLGATVAGMAVLGRVPAAGDYAVDLLPAIVLLAAGFGLAMPALTTLAMSDASPGGSGLASGLFNTTQQVGGALGLAVLATLAAARTEVLRAAGDARAAALTGGFRLAFTVAAGFVGTALLMHHTDGRERSYRDLPVNVVVYVPDPPGVAAAIRAEGLEVTREPTPTPVPELAMPWWVWPRTPTATWSSCSSVPRGRHRPGRSRRRAAQKQASALAG